MLEPLEPRVLLDASPDDLFGSVIDLGDRVTAPAIYGQKFDDLNGNGLRELDEPGLNGWTIELVDAGSGSVVDTFVTTDIDLDDSGGIDPAAESGWYWFDGLAAGEYEVREVGQTGWAASVPGLPSFEPHQLLPPQDIDSPNAMATIAVDMDKDGDLDLVTGHEDYGNDNTIQVLRNNGAGSFTQLGAYGWGAGYQDYAGQLAAGDFNNDGYNDIVAVDEDWNVLVFRNTGSGALASPVSYNSYPGYCVNHFVATSDVDNDNDVDIVVSYLNYKYGHGISVLKNNGNGTFATEVVYALGGDKQFVMADLDDDGYDDMAMNYYSHRLVALNDGTGAFPSVTEIDAPRGSGQSYTAVGDVDGDGDPDLVFTADAPSGGGDGFEIWLNDGDANFTVAQFAEPTEAATLYAIALGDVDGDGDLDLLGSGSTDRIYVMLNDGSGSFAPATPIPAYARDPMGLTAADLNADGLADVAVPYSYHSDTGVLLNRGAAPGGAYRATVEAGSVFRGRDFGNVAYAEVRGQKFEDLNADGVQDPGEAGLDGFTVELVDVATGEVVATQVTQSVDMDVSGGIDPETEQGLYAFTGLWPGDYEVREVSQAGFWQTPPGSLGLSAPAALTGFRQPDQVVAADFDGDGLDDLAVADYAGSGHSQVLVFRNQGDNTFAAPTVALTAPGIYTQYRLAAADVDGDNDLDLLAADTIDQDLAVLVNDGAGALALAGTYTIGLDTDVIAVGDVDGDGLPDVVVGESNPEELRVLLNAGGAAFDAPVVLDLAMDADPDTRQVPAALAMADADGDGDLDLLVGIADFLTPDGHQVRIYHNDGAGSFPTTTVLERSWYTPQAIAAADLDHDGDLDMVVGQDAPAVLLLTNDGEGGWTESLFTGWYIESIALTDLDGDGWLDAAMTSGSALTLLRNSGGGAFELLVELPYLGTDCRSLVATDVDGDGRNDLVGTSPGTDEVLILRTTATHPLTLQSGDAVADADFGNFRPNTIEGTKYYDRYGDGVKDDEDPLLADWQVFLDLNGNGELTEQTLTIESTDVPTYLDEGVTDASSALRVSGLRGVVSDIDVAVEISHPQVDELSVYLVSPLGFKVKLFGDVAGAGPDFSGTVLDDEAATAIADGTSPFTGRFQPEELLSRFDGLDPNGVWRLEVWDGDETQNHGSIDDWSLTLTVAEPWTTTDALGHYAFHNLPDGTYDVVEVMQPGWEAITPASGMATVDVAGGQTAIVDFGNRESGPPAELSATLVRVPTTTDANGEVASLPGSEPWIHEWEPFWVELWASTPSSTAYSIAAASADLAYDTAYLTAAEIAYGPAFTLQRSGAIDDAAGTVEDVGARTVLPSIGDDAFVLVARVKFEPGAGDDAPVDPVNRFIGPYDMGLVVSGPSLELLGYGSVYGTMGSTPSATELWALPYDGDDNGVVDADDFAWYRSAFLQQPGGGEPPYTWWADFDRSGLVDFGDFSYFAPNFLATKPDGGLTLPPNFPTAGGGPAMVVGLANDTGHGGASSVDGITRDPSLAGSVTDDNGVTAFTVQLNGEFIGSPVDALGELEPDGSFAFDEAFLQSLYGRPLADGVYTLQAHAESGLGNRSNLQFRFTLDRVAPSAPGAPDLVASSDSGALDSDNLTNATEPVVLVGGEAGTVVRVLVDGVQAAQGHAGTELTLGTLTEGARTLTAVCVDGAGNASTPSAPLTVTIDTHGPVVSAALANDTGASSWDGLTSEPGIAGTIGPEGALATLEARLTAAVGYVDVSGHLTTGGAFTLDRATLEQLNGGTLPEQEYTLRLRATDAAGNPSAILQTHFELDGTPPAEPQFELAAFYDTGAAGDWQTMLSEVTLEGHTEEGATVALAGATASTVADATGLFAVSGVALALGDNSVTLQATDAAGNTSTFTHTVTREAAPLVAMADPDLAAAIRAERGLAPGHDLDQADLYLLLELSADSNLVGDLGGLEYALNLASFTLAPSDFSVAGSLVGLNALTGLEHLESLALVKTGLGNADMTTLAGIAPLRMLDVSYNNVSDIAPLAGLAGLDSLRFYGTTVADISAFAGRPVDMDVPPDGLDEADTVAELAAALHYMPLDIYEHVVNTYKHTPYYGLMKGTEGVLDTGAGNDWELAHLLAELLGEAGITTRYVSGMVRAGVGDVMNWLGVTEVTSASRILRAAGEFGSASSAYLFRHTWLEAELAMPGGALEWVALDPSWKLRDYQPGVPDIVTLVPFDEAGYLSEVRTDLTWEFYSGQVADYLAANIPSTSVADVAYTGTIRQRRVDAVPDGLPYTVENSTTYATYAELSSMAHQARLTLEQGDTVLLEQTLVLPEMVHEPVVVGCVAAGGGQVTPELRVGEAVVATGLAVADGTSFDLTIEHYDPQYDLWRRDHTYTRSTGEVLSVVFDANQVSEPVLNALRTEVNDASLAVLNGDPDAMDAETGTFLTLAGWTYFDRCNWGEDVVAGLTWAVPVRTFVKSGVVTGTPGDFGNETLQVPSMPTGLSVDMGNLARSSLFAVDGFVGVEDPNNELRQRIIDFNGSAQEHAVWEELATTPAMSTIRSFQLASEAGIPRLVIDSTNAATLIPQLTLDPGTVVNIQAALAEGATVTVPRDPTPYHDWEGVGYLAEYPDGTTPYIISGELAGSPRSPRAFEGGMPARAEAQIITDVVNFWNQQALNDPVNIANGVVSHDEIDVRLPNIGIPLTFSRHYDTQLDADVGMGIGWTHGYSDALTFEGDGSITWTTFLGHRLNFTPDGSGAYTNPPAVTGTFAAFPGGYTYTEKDGQSHTFDTEGSLTEVTDRNGNALALTHDGNGHLATVADAADPSRCLTFTVDGAGRLTSMSDFTGRTWSYTYTDGRLTEVTGPSDADTPAYTIQYGYYTDTAREGLLRQVTTPDGGTTSYDYYPNRRAMQVTDPEGNTATLHYDLLDHTTRYTDERGFTTLYRHDDAGHLVSKTHPNGATETFVWEDGFLVEETDVYGQSNAHEYDASGNRIRTVDRAGIVTEYSYHPVFGFPTEVTVAGETTVHTYDAHGNLISSEDPLGNLTTMTYDARGLMLTRTSPNGNATPDPDDYTLTSTYDNAGQVLTLTTDLPATESFTYDDRGNVLTHTDANGHTTTYEYGLLGNRIKTIDAKTNETSFTYDTAGNLTSTTDALGRTATFQYDLRNLLVASANATGVVTTYEYDAIGNLVASTDELGHTTSYACNHRGQRTETLYADGTSTYDGYDGGGRHVAARDASHHTTWFAYDEAGRLVATTNPHHETTTRTYDAAGNLHTITDPAGATTTYAYDAANRQVSRTNGEGHALTFTYDADGNVTANTDALDHTTEFAYDVAGRLVQVTDARGGVATTTYDPVGNRIAFTDARGNTTDYLFDELNHLVETTDAASGVTTRTHDPFGKITSLTDARGHTTTYTYDSLGRLASLTDALTNTTTYAYDAAGNIVAITGPLGHTTTYAYDAMYREVEVTDALGNTTTKTYDANGNLATVTDPLGAVTTYEYDPLSRLTQTADALDNTARTAYDLAGNIAAVTDERGNTTTYEYDAVGHLVLSTDPLGNTWESTYDAAGNLASRTDPLGRTTTYTYDELDRRTVVTAPNGNTTTTTYDAVGNWVAVTDALDNTTEFEYDELNRKITCTDAFGETTTWDYDELGNTISETDPLTHVTTYTYDELNRLVAATDAEGATTTVDYDAAGRAVATTDARGATTTTYDPLGRILTTADALGNTTATQYDAAGNAIAVTNPRGFTTTYTYDPVGRPIAVTDALGNTSVSTYDEADNLIAFQDALGRTTAYTYDELNRRTAVIDALGNAKTTTYDEMGNVAAVTDALGNAVTFTYDAFGRLTSTTDALGNVDELTYDAVGNVVERTDARGGSTTFTYDRLGRLVAVTDPLDNTGTTDYDAAGNILAVTDPLDNTTTYTYDDVGRRTVVTNPLGKATTTTYDEAGNPLTVTDPLGNTTTTTYDEIGRLVTTTDALGGTTTLEYDEASNLTIVTDSRSGTTTYAYDPLNRNTTVTDALDNTTTNVYDAVGNLIALTDPLDNTMTYTFDALDRRVAVADPLGNTITSTYDDVGNLTAITDARGNTTTLVYDISYHLVSTTDPLGGTTTTTYDEAGNPTAVTDALGNTTAYDYDLNDQLVAVTDPLGNTTTRTLDPLGNLVAVTDARGNTTTFTYDASRRLTITTDPLGNATTYDYDEAGNQLSVTDALGNTTTYIPDELGRRITVTDALGNAIGYTYDSEGNVLTATDARDHTTTYEYDALNRLITVTDPLDNTITTVYDEAGNIVEVTDPLDRTTTYTYDATKNMTAVTDPLGNAITNTYDEAYNRISFTDELGRTTTYTRDALDRIIAATDPLGNTMAWEYDALGNTTRAIDELGRSTVFTYDALGRLLTTTNALGYVSSIEYDAEGNILARTDELGNTTEYVYDELNRSVCTTDALGGTTTAEYDEVGNLVGVADELDHAWTYAYDELRRLVTATDPLGNATTSTYDEASNLVALTNARGHTTTYTYDEADRLDTTTDPFGNRTTWTYDEVGNTTSITDTRENTTTYTYDELDRPTVVTDALDNATTTVYDAVGNVLSVTDALDRTTTFVYDDLDRLTDITDPLENTTTYAYDAVGDRIATTNALGNTTHFTYDPLGRPTTTTNALGGTTTYTYDAAGNHTALVDALGRTTTSTYDEVGRQTVATDPLGNATTYTYDAAGNLTATTNALGHADTLTYDALDRPIAVTDALGHTVDTIYDEVGNIVSVSDPMGNETTYTYDELDRLTVTTDPLGNATTTTFDEVGNVATLADPAGNTTTFVHDALNRLLSETNQSGHTQTYTYDDVGNLTLQTDRNGREREFVYDELDRLTQERWLDGAGDPIHTILLEYDAMGAITDASDDASAIHYTYDALGRQTAADNLGTPDAPQVVLAFAYDPVGNLLSQTDTIDGTLTGTELRTYDALDRLTRVTQHGTDATDARVDFTYNAISQIAAIDRYTDLAAADTPIHTALTYDDAARLTDIAHSLDAAPLASYAYTLDDNGRITEVVDADGTTAYTYDDAGQLLAATHSAQANESFAYDPAGNRTGGGYATGPDNRLTADGLFTYEYDNEGNRTQRTDLATGDVTEYHWDYRNRLTSVETRDDGGALLASVDYTYDALDRRIAKAADPDGAGPAFETATQFVCHGPDVLLQFDDAGDLDHRTLHGPLTDQVLADDTGALLWPLTDHQGTVRDLADATGAIADHRVYTSFGAITSHTEPTVAHPYAYTGREADAETGLLYYRARYYDPATGKFISEDPIAFDGGDTNLYRYVANSTPNAADPLGTLPQPALMALSQGLTAGAGQGTSHLAAIADAALFQQQSDAPLSPRDSVALGGEDLAVGRPSVAPTVKPAASTVVHAAADSLHLAASPGITSQIASSPASYLHKATLGTVLGPQGGLMIGGQTSPLRPQDNPEGGGTGPFAFVPTKPATAGEADPSQQTDEAVRDMIGTLDDPVRPMTDPYPQPYQPAAPKTPQKCVYAFPERPQGAPSLPQNATVPVPEIGVAPTLAGPAFAPPDQPTLGRPPAQVYEEPEDYDVNDESSYYDEVALKRARIDAKLEAAQAMIEDLRAQGLATPEVERIHMEMRNRLLAYGAEDVQGTAQLYIDKYAQALQVDPTNNDAEYITGLDEEATKVYLEEKQLMHAMNQAELQADLTRLEHIRETYGGIHFEGRALQVDLPNGTRLTFDPLGNLATGGYLVKGLVMDQVNTVVGLGNEIGAIAYDLDQLYLKGKYTEHYEGASFTAQFLDEFAQDPYKKFDQIGDYVCSIPGRIADAPRGFAYGDPEQRAEYIKTTMYTVTGITGITKGITNTAKDIKVKTNRAETSITGLKDPASVGIPQKLHDLAIKSTQADDLTIVMGKMNKASLKKAEHLLADIEQGIPSKYRWKPEAFPFKSNKLGECKVKYNPNGSVTDRIMHALFEKPKIDKFNKANPYDPIKVKKNGMIVDKTNKEFISDFDGVVTAPNKAPGSAPTSRTGLKDWKEQYKDWKDDFNSQVNKVYGYYRDPKTGDWKYGRDPRYDPQQHGGEGFYDNILGEKYPGRSEQIFYGKDGVTFAEGELSVIKSFYNHNLDYFSFYHTYSPAKPLGVTGFIGSQAGQEQGQ